ncbi:MAG: DUF2393 family protein [Wolinella sp.]
MEHFSEYFNLFTPYIERLELFQIAILGFILLLFVLLFVLGMLLRDKGGIAMLLPIACSLLLLSFAPFLIELAMTRVFFPIKLELKTNQRLAFSDSYFVDGTITNLSKRPIKSCILTITLARGENNPLKKLQSRLKPAIVRKELINKKLALHESVPFQYIIDKPAIEGNIHSHISAACY